jgi:hypothetical protein
MCEFGSADLCERPNIYVLATGRIANPGKTPVKMKACGVHVNSALREQLNNNIHLANQGMPGTIGVRVFYVDKPLSREV